MSFWQICKCKEQDFKVKLTKSRLKQIIAEELDTLLGEDSAGWPTVPPAHPKGSSGVCVQHTRTGTKKLYKGDEGYEDCVKNKAAGGDKPE